MQPQLSSARRTATALVAAALTSVALLPLASLAGTFRHLVNGTLQSADPGVSDLTPAPDGSKVYYISDYVEATDPEWYWVPSGGGAATLLAMAGPDYNTVITADGAYLVGENGFNLMSVATATGSVATLAAPGYPGSLNWQVSPDGKWLAYEFNHALYVIPVAGGTAVQVTPAAGTHPYLSDWQFMPNSSAVVFIYGADTSSTGWHLYAYPLPLGSGARVELSDPAGSYVDALAVTPDSSRVVYNETVGATEALHSVLPGGTGRLTISNSTQPSGSLVMSADSSKVYWVDWWSDTIRATSVTSNTDRNLITGGSVLADELYAQLQVTPDGSQVVFRGSNGTRADLYSLTTAGGTPVRINAAAAGSPEPETSNSASSFLILANSQRILYLRDETGTGIIELMSGKLDGTGAVRLDRDSLSGSDLSSSFVFYGFKNIAHVLPDSSYVIYSNDELVAKRTEVFAIHPNGVGRTKLNSALSTDAYVSTLGFAANDSLLVYAADTNGDGGSEPWGVTVPGFVASKLVDPVNVLTSVTRVCVPSAGTTLFYAASQDSPVNDELYAVPYTGGTPVKVNSALAAGTHWAESIEAAPGATHVAYEIYDGSYGYRSYHGASDGSGSSLIVAKPTYNRRFTADGTAVFYRAESLSVSGQYLIYKQSFAGGSPVQITPTPLNVASYDLSADGTTLVMTAAAAGGTWELFSMPAAGGTVVKLNPALTTGGNVTSFAIAPNSTKVAFIADAVTDGSFMLYSAPIGGGTATVLEAGSGSSDVDSCAISPDSTTVVFKGDVTVANTMELYAVPIGGGTRVKLNSALVANGDVDSFTITADSGRVIYLADGDTDGVMELYSAKIDGTSTLKLNPALVAGGQVDSFKISADGTWVAYLADQNTSGTYELFHVATTGGTVTRLHPAYDSTRDVQSDYQIVGSDHVIFRADHGGPVGQDRLFCTRVPDFVTNRLDNNTLAAGDVASFQAAPNGAYVAYLADQTTDGSRDLYVVYGVPDITVIPNQIGLSNLALGPLAFTVSDLETSAANLTLSAVSSNHTLLLDSGVSFGGAGGARTLTLVPNAGQWGLTTVTVTVSDGVHQAQMAFDVRIIPDPNAPPTGVTLAPGGVAENSPLVTLVGTLHTLDADPWDTHTYTLVGGAITKFTIAGDQLLTNDVFDYETTSSYGIVVRSTDFVGAFYDQNLTVSVIDVSGRPLSFNRVGPVNQRIVLSDSDFRSNFLLHDGPSLQRIRLESLPANGQLFLRFPEELIDGTVAGPRSIAAGDLNSDGRADLVVAGASGGTNVLVWYEQAAGTPKFPVPAGLHVIDSGPAIAQINHVAVADLDRDGHPDIVVSCGAPNNTVYLYRNLGGSAPVFIRSILTNVPVNPVSACVGKIDGDPDWDIVVASSGDNTVRVFRRNGTVGLVYFAPDVASAAEPGVADIALADIDKDGLLDIACADPTSNETVWLRNNGGMPPTFTRRIASTLVPGVSCIAVGDLNKDTNLDFVVASRSGNRVDGLISNGASPPGFTQLPLLAGFNAPAALALADVDGDSDQDVVALSATSGKVVLLENSGTPLPTFHQLDIDRNCAGASCVFAGDLNGDGKIDLAAGAGTANSLSWYQNSSLPPAGTEMSIDEAQKLSYQPNAGFVGLDSFNWRGYDGVQWSFDAATVSFSIYGTEYWNWLVANFTLPVVLDPAKRASVWGSTADPDHDGVTNLIEYALNGNPNNASSRPQLTLQILPDTGLDHLFATYPLRTNETSLTYTLELSGDLSTWHSGTGYFSHVAPDTLIDTFFNAATYKVLTDVDGASRQFVRLRIDWALD